MINLLSSLIIPFLVLFIIIYAIFKKKDVYNLFIEGAKESFPMITSLFPSMLAMILGVNIIVKSGFISFIFSFLSSVTTIFRIPLDVLPMMLIRPISGSSALALLNNILNKFGPDSFEGILASLIQGSTDTTFYVLTLYFGSVGIKKIRYSLWAGLFADLVGIVISIIITNYLI